MDEPFIISVNYQGTEMDFEARFERRGYGHRFQVQVEGIPVFFERDEEGNYRALLAPDQPIRNSRNIDVHLLEAISQKITSLLA